MATFTGQHSKRARIRDNPAQPVSSSHHFAQVWFLTISLCLFAVYVAWDLQILQTVFRLDRSYMTWLIAAITSIATCHAAWHVFLFSQRIEAAQALLHDAPGVEHAMPDNNYIAQFIEEIQPTTAVRSVELHSHTTDSILEIYADKLRSPVDLGWFLVDLAVRLGLLGTIIGFILIFTSLSNTTIGGSDGLKELLVSMSGGMGTALLTTLGGLIGATVLSFQYLILGRENEYLIGLLIRIRNRFSTSEFG